MMPNQLRILTLILDLTWVVFMEKPIHKSWHELVGWYRFDVAALALRSVKMKLQPSYIRVMFASLATKDMHSRKCTTWLPMHLVRGAFVGQVLYVWQLEVSNELPVGFLLGSGFPSFIKPDLLMSCQIHIPSVPKRL